MDVFWPMAKADEIGAGPLAREDSYSGLVFTFDIMQPLMINKGNDTAELF